MSVSRHKIIAIVSTEHRWRVQYINKWDRWGQWVNVFSMVSRLALGRDEVEELTQGSKGQVTQKQWSRPSTDSAGDPKESPPSSHTSLCMKLGAPAVKRSNVGNEGVTDKVKAQLTGCAPVPKHFHSYPSIPQCVCYQSYQKLSMFIQNYLTQSQKC